MRWVYDTTLDSDPANFHGDPLIDGDLIIVGSDVSRGEFNPEAVGHVYAFDRATGAVHWRHEAQRGVGSDIVKQGKNLFGLTVEGTLLCLDSAGGKRRWSAGADASLDDSFHHFSPLLVGDRVLFTTPDGGIHAVDVSSGSSIWSRQLSDRANTPLVRLGDAVYVGTFDNKIQRIDPASGRTTAEMELDSFPYGIPVAVEDSLLVLLEGGTLARIHSDLRRVIWSRTISEEWSSHRPLILDAAAVVMGTEGELQALGIDNGQQLWSRQVEGTVRGLGASDDILYVGTLSGKLYAFRLRGPGEASARDR